MPNSLIFIGERPSHLEMYVKGKPDFYDAIHLSKESHHTSSTLSYHSIPLHQSHVSIHILESKSQFNCHQQSLQLIAGERLLSEEEAFEFFTNFAIMEDNKVAFLMNLKKRKIRKKEKEDPGVLLASREIEV